jgi:hypothetical protein
MRSLLQLTAAAVFALLAGGCATTMTVSSHVQHRLDFTQYRTYDWGPADALPTGDPRLDGNPFFKDHFEGAVEKALAGKGLERTASGPPDLLIHYHASVTRRLDVDRLDRKYGYCSGEPCVDNIVTLEAGTIVLDVVDARANRVVWRGWAQERLDVLLDNPDRLARKINEAVDRMLRRLPPTLENGQ